MKPIILALILLNSSVIASALAQTVPGPYPRTSYPVPDPRVAQLETALNQVRQELQVLYQQFLVMQALRQNEIQESFPLATYVPSIEKSPYATSGLIDNPPQSYDEKIRSQKEHQERIQQYYSRHQQLAFALQRVRRAEESAYGPTHGAYQSFKAGAVMARWSRH